MSALLAGGSVARYRKKPVEVEAVRFTGSNRLEIMRWLSPQATPRGWTDVTVIEIRTLEGTMKAVPGDWVIKGVKGEFYPCKPDIFEATYETVT